MIDTHIHSTHSHDGRQKIEAIIRKAKSLGLTYLAVTDHCDWDYLAISGYEYFQQLNIKGYLEEMEKIKEKTKGLFLAVGLELGYHNKASKKYKEVIPFERFDYIINSVHSIGNHDVYFPAFFEGKERSLAYRQYLLGVLESVEAPYPYNTIGHIGYIAKNSIYDNKLLTREDFPDIIDSILKLIIEKDKTLELNSNIKGDICMPNPSIIKRYFELGGDNITFASDAHKTNRLGEGYDILKDFALENGFRYWTIYKNRNPEKIRIS
ncbi:MAG: histidinol-phosphatase HisJ family protein [Bacillota bacterium]